MHTYNFTAKLKDAFYGVPVILGGTRGQDARALASMSAGMVRMRATNGRHYWYYFLKDIKNRDLIRFLMHRNGLRPEFHMSKYYDYDNKQPAFRVRMSVLMKYSDLLQFTNDIKDAFDSNDKVSGDMARYIDTINQKLGEQKRKMK